MSFSVRWSRRAIVRHAAGALAVTPLLGRVSPVAASAPPNFVLILADDMRADELTRMPQVQQRLVKAGLTFTRAFATTPLCAPSRASILRGQYAHNHGVVDNTGDHAGDAVLRASDEEQSTLAVWLQRAGYRTGLVGKYLNDYPTQHEPTRVPPGWDQWAAVVDHNAYAQYDYQLNDNGRLVAYGHAPTDYLTDVLAGKATAFIQQAAADQVPFLLYLAPFAPHAPSVAPPRYADAFADLHVAHGPAFNLPVELDQPAWLQAIPPIRQAQITALDARERQRLRSLAAVDDLVGAVGQALTQAGTLANTFIWFTSDNGVFLGEHRLRHGKNAPYEEAIHMPLVVRGPGVSAGASEDGLVGLLDLGPTFADLAGVAAPSFVDGRSLRPLLAGHSADPGRQTLLIEGFGGESDEGDDASEARVPPFAGLRTADALYVEYDTKERELYNLAADPGETINLINRADAGTIAALAGRLAALRGAREADARAWEAAPLAVTLP